MFYDILVKETFGLLTVIVTALVGALALYIYKKQVSDTKTLVARTIFSEINSAVNKLTGIKSRFFAVERPNLENIKIMKHESWTKYKQLFLKDLSSVEWNIIDDFYNNCFDYDLNVELNNSSVDTIVELNYKYLYERYYEIIKNTHNAHKKMQTLPKTSANEYLAFQALYLDKGSKNNYNLDYVPLRGTSGARIALIALDTAIVSGEAGIKLKKIGRL